MGPLGNRRCGRYEIEGGGMPRVEQCKFTEFGAKGCTGLVRSFLLAFFYH